MIQNKKNKCNNHMMILIIYKCSKINKAVINMVIYSRIILYSSSNKIRKKIHIKILKVLTFLLRLI